MLDCWCPLTYLCRSKSFVQGKVKGPWRVQHQLKKPVKGQSPRWAVCWAEGKRILLSQAGGNHCPSGKSMISPIDLAFLIWDCLHPLRIELYHFERFQMIWLMGILSSTTRVQLFTSLPKDGETSAEFETDSRFPRWRPLFWWEVKPSNVGSLSTVPQGAFYSQEQIAAIKLRLCDVLSGMLAE